jgi:oligopeptidase B
MGAGHGGAPGRFSRLDEVAIAYAFALWAVGMADNSEV